MELLVTGAWQDAENHIIELEGRGHRVHFLQYEKEELPYPPDQIEGVICNGLFLYHEISEFKKLRYIQLTSAGYDRVPMDYIKEHNIEIHNARGVYSIPMAEYAIAGVLSLYKKADIFRENQRQHRWVKQRDLLELYGKTVCIFGCGNVGCECARRFSAFGARVIGVDLILSQEAKAIFEHIYSIEEAVAALMQSDVIVSTLPLTDSTRHFFGRDKFSKMKKTAVYVNISRGGTTDTEALTCILSNRQIAGAVLDVFEEEPLDENSALWDMENVILSPHNSFVGDGNRERLAKVILTNLTR